MSAQRQTDVLVAGDLFFDLVMSGFETWPNPGEESFAKEFHREVGGGAAITACCLSRLGFRTLVFGVAGKSGGQWMLDELRSRQRRIEETQIAIEAARRTPAMVGEVFDKLEAAVRVKLKNLRAALAIDPAGARDAYLALFPEGLTFRAAEVGKARGPRRTRRVWAISGMAHLGVCNLVVTPPGLEPGISA